MKRLKITFAFILIIALSAGCSEQPTVIELSKGPIIINEAPTVLTLDPPLFRRNRSLSIRMRLNESWASAPQAPRKKIRLDDGTLVTINIVLISEKEETYRSLGVGKGDGLDIRFEDSVPKDAGIMKILLSSSYPIPARSIKWVDWNPN